MPRKKSATYTLQPGTVVFHKSKEYAIIQILDFKYILAKSLLSGEIERLSVSDISRHDASDINKSSSIIAIPDEDWQVAQQRMEVIQPLLYKADRTKADVEVRASEYNLHINTLYKWLNLYENTGLLTSLTPNELSLIHI